MRLVIGAALALLLAACGEDDQQLILEPADGPSGHAATPPVFTPVNSATATADPTTTVTASVTPTAGTPTATPTPTATATPVDIGGFVGVYDVSFDTQFRTSDAIAEVFPDGDEVTIVFFWSDGHGLLSLQGTPTADGRVTLEGFGGIPYDFLFPAEGTARFAEVDGRQRVHGSSSNASGPSRPFVLDRPVLRAPSAFNGTYRFAFDPSPGGCQCTTNATFSIAVDKNGVGASTLAADELGPSDGRQGTFDPDECLITTRGRLRCVLRYETTFVPMPGQPPAGPVFPVTLMGVLAANGNTVTGEGASRRAGFPPGLLPRRRLDGDPRRALTQRTHMIARRTLTAGGNNQRVRSLRRHDETGVTGQARKCND